MTNHSIATLTDWSAQILASCQVPAEDALQAAQLLVRSELRGYATHGMARLPSYVERLLAKDFNPSALLRQREFPGGVVLDADGAMGQIAGARAVRLALQGLERSASVLVAIQSCGHMGALGVYALLAAEAGAMCLLGQRTPPLLAMEGFTGAAIGHNPIAFGCPAPGGPPIVFDIACSVAARGHVLVAAREGRDIPAGWALDSQGRPTTDPQAALAGALLPMGGHKGIGIAMVVECLAGALAASAASFAPQWQQVPTSGAVGRQSAFLWMLRPQAFAPQPLRDDYMRLWIDHYRACGGAHARLPGQRAAEQEQRAQRMGIELPERLVHQLRALGTSRQRAFPA
ncbi:Ldh family oxidoreductase [Verminephrobacter eiseniae]|uniref:Ldh family oxidoreductase n=1 Tax=Verminephrobacter eiseniae TaxID=364317 RepID=UPI0022371E62|nr:Ldh family oxidoreductase [Verminephrobacter eiseniae]MCW5231055.1 Ldh family oxidoreductase [Verminephrobacter eiseniae]MCW5292788.1 Ldh family oxidoreductase [Verminephrobacter eiseniae]MCW8184681.1 Ldh family oxidoreductase [Verminephrobacter eiseniae]MCW8223357.1 Ldh family oxidoreductase [Verminephrobacter eiseniae]MCW8234516.1 Ldh family oxidoreductase [Verminephrobacter eiseniae]